MINDAFKYLIKQLWFWIVVFFVIVVLVLSSIGLISWYAIFEAVGIYPLVLVGVLFIIPFLWGAGTAFNWFFQEENPRLIVGGGVMAVVLFFIGFGYFNIMPWWIVWLILAILAVVAFAVIGAVSIYQENRARDQPRSHTVTKSKKPNV